MRFLLIFIFGLLSVSAFAQNGFVSKQAKITRTYEQVSATYIVIADEGSGETVYCKFRNQGTRPALVVFTITNADGGTSQKQIEISAAGLGSINIGDISSVTISLAHVEEGEDSQNKNIADRAEIRDLITKEDGKLTALNFEKKVAKTDIPAKKEVAPSQIKAILELIFGANSAAGMTFNDEDRKMAEYFLKELVDGSCKMSYAKALFNTAYNFDPGIKSLVFDLIKGHEDCDKNAKNGQYYQTVVVTIRAKYRTAFSNRKQNGEWLMTVD